MAPAGIARVVVAMETSATAMATGRTCRADRTTVGLELSRARRTSWPSSTIFNVAHSLTSGLSISRHVDASRVGTVRSDRSVEYDSVERPVPAAYGAIRGRLYEWTEKCREEWPMPARFSVRATRFFDHQTPTRLRFMRS